MTTPSMGAQMSFTAALVVAHRSHAQALADGEVAPDTYPHLDLGLADFDTLAAVHIAVDPTVTYEAARGVFEDVEAEGVQPGTAAYLMPDGFTQAAALLDVAGKKRVAAQLVTDKRFRASVQAPRGIIEFVDSLVKLGEEATKSGREIVVLVR